MTVYMTSFQGGELNGKTTRLGGGYDLRGAEGIKQGARDDRQVV